MGRGREVGPASRYQQDLLVVSIQCYSSSYSASRKRSPVEQDSICMHIYVYFSMRLGQVAVASASPRATYDVIDATPSPASVKDVYCATVYDRGGPRVAVTVSSTAKHDIRDGGYICFFSCTLHFHLNYSCGITWCNRLRKVSGAARRGSEKMRSRLAVAEKRKLEIACRIPRTTWSRRLSPASFPQLQQVEEVASSLVAVLSRCSAGERIGERSPPAPQSTSCVDSPPNLRSALQAPT